MERFIFALVAVFALATEASAYQSLYLVRHAEKKDASKDPGLSEAGQTRAKALAKVLRDAEIKAVYTSEYKRTQKTAEPLVTDRKIKAQTVADTKELIKVLQADTSNDSALIVGHGNTVPEILKAFGGDQTIADDEFDRLFIVTLPKDGKPVIQALRY